MQLNHEIDYVFEDHPAATEIRTVIPGVYWLRMPLPFALDHINLWMLDDGPDSVVLIDTGFGLDEVRQHWEHILAQLGRRVSGIVVTHCHPDHVGLADWLAKRCHAPIFMTQGEFFGAHAIWHQQPGFSVQDMLDSFRLHGLDDERLSALEQRGNGYRVGVPSLPKAFNRMFDQDVLRIGEHHWRIMVGYGHSPEHAALYCAELGVLISGDMLLPRISTNVSVFAATPDDDPLGWFLCSLHALKDLPDHTLVLPSHGLPFRGIRARIEQLDEHHRERCETLLEAMPDGCSAASLLETLFPRKLDTHQVMFAMGEAIAHLNHLVKRGELKRLVDADGNIRFKRTA